ncbi:hypothetical protein SAMN05216571_102174 [Onishia taeanensis]|uniref:Uncharacterized protein n=1 Tax=Onishia taeanensis TaxID=284577 RepID=A0A1G7P9Y3_9GAMM|nr:hypothetical protein [Halomonas taeanensis]SDF82409.1 hypothetical protein SAMN05216571_102174 [Halomonas taeanensis]
MLGVSLIALPRLLRTGLWVVRADLGEWTLYATVSVLIMAAHLPPVARRLPRFRQRLAGIR